ncbi:MAG: M1 family metallopeptidase, partial [Deltaproteobacteria bacterium]|nr:M1 family metallopeptidase [Deltaproteobacteria bacterium]
LVASFAVLLVACFAARWTLAERPSAPPSSAAGELEPGQGSTDYRFEAVLDPNGHEVRGEGTIRFTNRAVVPVRELWVHAYLNAFRDDESVFMRGPAEGFRGERVLTHRGGLDIHRLRAREFDAELLPALASELPRDATDLRVPLPRELGPGEVLTLEVAFTARLPSLFLRTGFVGSYHMVAQWYPKLARLERDGRWAHFPFYRLSEFYADFGDYDVTVDVPEGMVVGATGAAAAADVDGGRRRQRFQATRVHDFAFTAWDGFDEIRQMAGATELVALFPRGEEAEAEIELATASRGLAHFGERYGGYPYPRLTIVRPPAEASEAGGMEYPTLITTGASRRGRALGLRGIESLTLHELAHQWFQGMLASDEHQHPALDEGLASYAEIEAMDAFWPGRSAFDAFGLRSSEAAAFRWIATEGAGRGAVSRSVSEFADGRDYVENVYGRMATVLVTLGRVHGEAAMRRALHRYATTERFRHPVPADLVRHVRESVGEDAARALDAVLEGGRFDAYVIRHEARPTSLGDGSWSGTVTVGRRGEVVLPVTVEVRAADGSRNRLEWDGRGEEVTLPWSGRAPIVAVRLDPDSKLLLDDDLSNQALGEPAQASRVRALLVAVGQLLLEVVGP